MTNEPNITCGDTLDNLVAYIQSEIGDDEIGRRIEAHLAECEMCRRQEGEIRKTFDMVRETYHEFAPSERAWQELLERLHGLKTRSDAGRIHEAEEPLAEEPVSPPPVSAPAPEALVVPRRRRMTAAVLTVGAVIAVVVAAAFLAGTAGFKITLKEGSRVSLYSEQDGQWREIEPGRGIGLNARLKTAEEASAAVLIYPDGSRLDMARGTELRIIGEKTVRLERGELSADITPAGAGFTVQTEFGEVEVLGTRFKVTVSKETLTTRLQVYEGRVRFANGGTERTVETGYWSQAGKDAPPIPPYKAARSEAFFPTKETVEVSLSVFDGARYLGAGDLEMPVIHEGAPLRVRFEIKNLADEELLLPTGRTGGNMIQLVREGTQAEEYFLMGDVPTCGNMVEDRPHTAPDEKEVRLAPGETYQFVYEIPLARTGMHKGHKYWLYGRYHLVAGRKVAVELK